MTPATQKVKTTNQMKKTTNQIASTHTTHKLPHKTKLQQILTLCSPQTSLHSFHNKPRSQHPTQTPCTTQTYLTSLTQQMSRTAKQMKPHPSLVQSRITRTSSLRISYWISSAHWPPRGQLVVIQRPK